MSNLLTQIMCICIALLASTTNAFFQQGGASTVSKAVTDEAIAIYNKRYAAKAAAGSKKPFNQDWGLPKTDIDGSSVRSTTGSSTKRIFEVDEKKQRATFQELSKLYGADNALTMVKDLPGVLGFDKASFAPSLKEFSNTFGEEEAKEMVMRNPGLLAIKPIDAAAADDTTMKFSYIVATTRPAGPVLLYGTLGLLSLPVIEGISGVPFRAQLIQNILQSAN